MKYFILFFLGAIGFNANAQMAGTGIGSNSTATGRMDVYSWAQRPDEDGTDLQKRFLKQEWTEGIVKFRSGRPDIHAPLLFDVFDNTLYFLQDSVVMEFVDSVSEVQFITYFNKDTVQMLYRRFYPAIQANTPATFYKVLVEAKVQLLKCSAKSILLFKEPETPEQHRETPPEFLYFASLPNGKIVQVEHNAEKLMNQLPEYREIIREIIQKEKLKVKDEQRMIQLFVHLNNKLQEH